MGAKIHDRFCHIECLEPLGKVMAEYGGFDRKWKPGISPCQERLGLESAHPLGTFYWCSMSDDLCALELGENLSLFGVLCHHKSQVHEQIVRSFFCSSHVCG